MTTATTTESGEVGIALQSAEGTLATNPTYAQPLYSGLPRPVESMNEIEVTDNSGLLVIGHYKDTQFWEMDLTIPVTPVGHGAYIKSILPTLSTAGTSDPRTHTFTPTGGTALPPFVTMFALAPGSQYRKFGDGTVTELVYNFEHGQMLKANVKAVGYTPADIASAYTATTTEVMDSDGPWYTMVGGTFKMDAAATPATTSVATIRSGALSIAREVELIQTDGFNPEHRAIGRFRVALSAELLFENYQLFKNTFYGSTSGTASSPLVVFGAADLLFQVGPTTNANRTLQYALPNIALRVPEPPDSNPSGGPLVITVAGVSEKPSSGEIITGTYKSSATTF